MSQRSLYLLPAVSILRLERLLRRGRRRLGHRLPPWIVQFTTLFTESATYLRTLVMSILYPLHFYSRVTTIVTAPRRRESSSTPFTEPVRYFAGWAGFVFAIFTITHVEEVVPQFRGVPELVLVPVFAAASFAVMPIVVLSSLSFMVVIAAQIALLMFVLLITSVGGRLPALYLIGSHVVVVNLSLWKTFLRRDFWRSIRWPGVLLCLYYYTLNLPVACGPIVALLYAVSNAGDSIVAGLFVLALLVMLPWLIYAMLVRPFVCAIIYNSLWRPRQVRDFPELTYVTWPNRRRFYLSCSRFTRVDLRWRPIGRDNMQVTIAGRPLTFRLTGSMSTSTIFSREQMYAGVCLKFPDGSSLLVRRRQLFAVGRLALVVWVQTKLRYPRSPVVAPLQDTNPYITIGYWWDGSRWTNGRQIWDGHQWQSVRHPRWASRAPLRPSEPSCHPGPGGCRRRP